VGKVAFLNMIRLSRLNGKEFILNCELIKVMESTPDTVITLTHGEKIMVREDLDTVIQRTMDYRKRLYQEPPSKEEVKKWT
jgi:flagellar protein FlbD